MQNIFVYGTLLSQEIIKNLTGKSFKTSPAVLKGYKKHCVKGGDYPAIIKMKDSNTAGIVIENVDDDSIDILSFYEGDDYEKKFVTVLSNGQSKGVFAFVWRKSAAYLEDREWDFQQFQENSLEIYLNKVVPDTLKEFEGK
ncbi:MAG TPA: gamma-glutamylcyclotransferase family protein [Draconibacterium sp.]|nr:gamma-glutamylcyclotransferase family protein [Draconibacterium sp.]